MGALELQLHTICTLSKLRLVSKVKPTLGFRPLFAPDHYYRVSTKRSNLPVNLDEVLIREG